MSDKILKEIIEKINNKGYPTKNSFFGLSNGIARDKHGHDYITIICKNTEAIANYIIDLALNQKLKENASYRDDDGDSPNNFNSDTDHIDIDWRILPTPMLCDEKGLVIRTRLTAARYPIYYNISGFGLSGTLFDFSVAKDGVYQGVFSNER